MTFSPNIGAILSERKFESLSPELLHMALTDFCVEPCETNKTAPLLTRTKGQTPLARLTLACNFKVPDFWPFLGRMVSQFSKQDASKKFKAELPRVCLFMFIKAVYRDARTHLKRVGGPSILTRIFFNNF